MENGKRRERHLKLLSVEIPLELHREIKYYALRRNISLRRWIIRALLQQIKDLEYK